MKQTHKHPYIGDAIDGLDYTYVVADPYGHDAEQLFGRTMDESIDRAIEKTEQQHQYGDEYDVLIYGIPPHLKKSTARDGMMIGRWMVTGWEDRHEELLFIRVTVTGQL